MEYDRWFIGRVIAKYRSMLMAVSCKTEAQPVNMSTVE